jgi:acyl homoserine lactone synthase
MYQVIAGTLADNRFAQRYAEPMFRLRYRVFHERLGWQVRSENGQERDQFDDRHSHYLLLLDDGAVAGGWRLRQTTEPYMLQDVFPQLLNGQPAPRHPNIWEISRFAIDVSGDARSRFGLNAAAQELLKATTRYALERGIARYVMVASAAAERLYRHAGLTVHRFGAPQRIGRVLSLGCWIDVDEHTCQVLLGHGLPIPVAA